MVIEQALSDVILELGTRVVDGPTARREDDLAGEEGERALDLEVTLAHVELDVLVAELRPQLVLLDVQLPDFDGFEVARRLHAENREVEIVLTSSRDASDYGSLVAESPARGFVPKAELSGEAISALIG